MPIPIPSSVAPVRSREADPFAQAQMAAAAYLARYSGRTLERYRYDLRTFFQWCIDLGLDVLEATRPHIELWRNAMEERGLAASTIDRRLSTICGFYRFAYRRPDPIEPGAARSSAQGVPKRRTWSRPG
jgi:site-specific recombinase XerD